MGLNLVARLAMSNAKYENSLLKKRFNFENCYSEYESVLDQGSSFLNGVCRNWSALCVFISVEMRDIWKTVLPNGSQKLF